MNKQQFLNFLQPFQSKSALTVFKNSPCEYAKLYTTYTTETKTIPAILSEQNRVVFIHNDINYDNSIKSENLLSDKLIDMFKKYKLNDEEKAIVEIVDKESEIYSKDNLINEPFTKESFQKAITKVLQWRVKPKALLVSCDLMCKVKGILDEVFYDYFTHLEQFKLIVNPYIKSCTFAAIITDAPKGLAHLVKRPIELSVIEGVDDVSVVLIGESYFKVNPMAICTISF